MKKRWTGLVAMALCFTFLLGLRDGKIVLWRKDSAEPVKVFPYPVSLLPPEAVDALEKGIPIESEEELRKLIRQYLF